MFDVKIGESKAMGREEKLKRKSECEKRRREKIKEDADKHLKLKELKHQIYVKAKEMGKVKSVSDMTAREQRVQRNNWRLNQKSLRKRKKLEKKVQIDESSSTSTDDTNEDLSDLQSMMDVSAASSVSASSQRKRGWKIAHRAGATAYRKLKKVMIENELLKQKAEKYRKKNQELLNKIKLAKEMQCQKIK